MRQEPVQALIQEGRNRFKVPAMAVAVMNAQDIILQEVQGLRVADGSQAATQDDYFHIGSCAKSALAVVAAHLIEQGLLAWQTPFFNVLPELLQRANAAYGDITLEDLLRCRAGIKAYTNAGLEPLPVHGDDGGDPRAGFVRSLLGQPPVAKKKNGQFPFVYSNASYTLASAMLEKITGLTYEQLVTKLGSDLGLSFRVGWPNDLSPEQPWGHIMTKGKMQPLPPGHEYRLPHLLTPAGDLSMTPRDYAKYTQRHLQGLRGQDNYVRSTSYQHIHNGHQGFSLGVVNSTLAGHKLSGFDGSAGTFFCRSAIFSDDDMALCIMMNAGSGTAHMPAMDWLTMRLLKLHFLC